MKSCLRALFSFAIAGSLFYAPAGQGRVLDRTLVTINDEVVLESDLEKFSKKMQSKSFVELFGGVDPKIFSSQESLLNLLIEEKLMDQQIKKLELLATPQEIDGQIRSILKRNGITEQQLNERLKQLGSNLKEYKEGIKRQIERRNLMDREVRPSVDLSDDQLRHFYQRQAKGEDAETQYRIAHILIQPVKGDWTQAEARAKQIHEALKAAPSEFEKYAKDTSDDPSTSETGGVLGFFNSSALAKEFRAVVPKTSTGQITAPIKTAAGFHIVRVIETRRGDFSNLSKDRKDALKNQMIGEELERKMALWLERKRSESHIKIFKDTSAAAKSQSPATPN